MDVTMFEDFEKKLERKKIRRRFKNEEMVDCYKTKKNQLRFSHS